MKDERLAVAIWEKVSPADTQLLHAVAEKSSGKNSSSETSCIENSHASTDDADCSVAEAGVTCKEIAMRANDIRSCGKNGDLKGAIKVFERLGTQASNTLIWNSMLDSCIECKDMQKAVEFFDQCRANNLADVISYNTMMKGYLANGQEGEAKKAPR